MGVMGLGRTLRAAEIMSPQRRCGGFAMHHDVVPQFAKLMTRLARRDGAIPAIRTDLQSGIITQISGHGGGNLSTVGPWQQEHVDLVSKIAPGESHTFAADHARGLFNLGARAHEVTIERRAMDFGGEQNPQVANVLSVRPAQHEARLAAMFRPALTRGLLATVFRIDLQGEAGLGNDQVELNLSSIVYAAQASLAKAVGMPTFSTTAIDIPSLAHAFTMEYYVGLGLYEIPMVPLPPHTVPLQRVTLQGESKDAEQGYELQLSLRLVMPEPISDGDAYAAPDWFVRGANLVLPKAPQAVEIRVHDPLGIAFAPARIAQIDGLANAMSQHFAPALAHYGRVDPNAPW